MLYTRRNSENDFRRSVSMLWLICVVDASWECDGGRRPVDFANCVYAHNVANKQLMERMCMRTWCHL